MKMNVTAAMDEVMVLTNSILWLCLPNHCSKDPRPIVIPLRLQGENAS
jgi:hypothetical protein